MKPSHPVTRAAYAMAAADPHQHGLRPCGCGCMLFHDRCAGKFYQQNLPCTYFASNELHLGAISLACSRPGAAAVVLWTTQCLLLLLPGGKRRACTRALALPQSGA